MLEWPVGSDFKSNLCDVHNLEHSTQWKRTIIIIMDHGNILRNTLDMIDTMQC